MTTLMLFVVLLTGDVGDNGVPYESLHQVSGIEHKSATSCHIEKSHYTNSNQARYFCGDPMMYFNKENKMH